MRIGVVGSCQNLSIILEIKLFKNWCYQKMSITKNELLSWYYSMKKNWERFRWFLTSKIDFESQILALFDTSPLHQFSQLNNFLWICWCFRQKSFQFSTPRLKTWQPVLPYYALCIYRCKKKIDFDNFFNPHLPIFVLMGRRTLLNCWKIDKLKTEMKSI